MQAYERSMQHGDTHLVLRPDSDFFRYFGDPMGKAPEGSTTAAAPSSTSAAPDPQPSSNATK
jgi:membrane protease subunit HflC